jgi:hypothetical protein
VSAADGRQSVKDPNQLATVETVEDRNQLATVDIYENVSQLQYVY